MGLRFALGKQQNTNKLLNNYIIRRLQHKKAYDKQLYRLDEQNKQERIDELEFERLRTILEMNYYQQQVEVLRELQTHIQKLISGFNKEEHYS